MLNNGAHAFCLDLAAKHILKVEMRKAVLSFLFKVVEVRVMPEFFKILYSRLFNSSSIFHYKLIFKYILIVKKCPGVLQASLNVLVYL